MLKATRNPQSTNTALVASKRGWYQLIQPYLSKYNHLARIKCCSTCALHNKLYAGYKIKYYTHLKEAIAKQEFKAVKEAALLAKEKN